jgi:hypothetical protein
MLKSTLMVPYNFINVWTYCERRILDNIFMKLIAVISHDNYYSQFYHPSCELVIEVMSLWITDTMFHLLLDTVLPEFDHCLEIYTFSALQ